MRTIYILLLSLILNSAYSKPKADSTLLLKPFICGVSVDTNSASRKMIYWKNIDTNAIKFIIYEKDYLGSTFDSIGIVNAKKYNEYIDYNNINFYYPNGYKIQAVNKNNIRSELSTASKNIFFEALEVVDDSVIRLTWTRGNTNDSIIIWRRNMEPDFKIVNKLSMSDTSYFDTVPYLVWQIEYRLEIIKNDPCISNSDTTKSKRLFANQAYAHFGVVSNTTIKALQVYPNPVNNSFNLTSETIFQNAHIYIYNTLGQLIVKTIVNKNEIDVGDLTEGMYHFTLEHKGKWYSGKFIRKNR